MPKTVVIEVTGDNLTVATAGRRFEGTTRWFGPTHGFIVCPDVAQEVFVHFSDLDMEGRKTLAEGQDVEFTLGDKGKGPCALKVKPLSTYNTYWSPSKNGTHK
jgi:CspA family cold shock protein